MKISAYLIRTICLAVLACLIAACGGGGGKPPVQNQAPSASFTVSLPPGGAPMQVKFFNQSTDSDGTLVNFDWDFDGDGNFDQTGTEPDGLFLYQQPVTAQATLRVTDNGGLTSTFTDELLIPASTFGSAVVESQGNDEPTSFGGLEVDGNPAVFFTTQGKLAYYRANDVSGTEWGDAVVPVPESASFTSAAIVAGNPAVLYHSSGTVRYVRANDVQGSSWAAPQSLNVASFEGDAAVTLLMVDGQPAALFEAIVGGAPGRVFYLRASDALGATWDTGSTINTTPAGLSLQDMGGLLVDGRPAYVCVADTGEMLYIRAEDRLGASWPSVPVEVAPGVTLTGPSAAIIAGKPAIAAAGNNSLVFVQSVNADGSVWGTPQTVISAAGALTDASLANTGARTVIAFRTAATGALDLVIAADAAGNEFQSPINVEAANTLGHFVLPLSGAPGVIYNLDGSGVEYSGAQ